MKGEFTARASISIQATPDQVWTALTTPAMIKEYLMGTNVSTDWKEGSPISYTGEYQGKEYHDKGIIKKVERNKLLQSTYWSSMSGLEDKPENYALVTYTITGEDGNTTLSLLQENIATKESMEHSTESWKQVLSKLKEVVEKK